VPNPNLRFDPEQIYSIAEEVVYVCHSPMFDNMMDDSFIPKFEHKIVQQLDDFDPETDVVAYYGDCIIFGMMIMWLADAFSEFDIARYSSKQNQYLVRRLSYDKFTGQADQEPARVQSTAQKRPPLRPALR
jgi:hypothetical protein